MEKGTPVSAIMTKKVVVANVNNKFTQVRKLFLEFNLHHLPVTENDVVIGMISTRDVLKAYQDIGSKIKVLDDKVLDNKILLADIMTKNPDTIGPMDSIKKAAEMFVKKKYHALPVVEDGKIRGIISSNDLIKFVLD